MRLVSTLALCLSGVAGYGATLERLSLDEMTARSTAIVRARAVSNATSFLGSTIYTQTRFQVMERWKGPESAEVQVWEPGGTVGAVTQSYPGVPRFPAGQELVLFLWTGRSGRTQVIGLSQGVFEVTRSASTGEEEVLRRRSGEIVLAPGSGMPVEDGEIVMPMRQLASRVRMIIGREGRR